ncbi:hypothetical protein IL306_005397 [Fusarium sp. DS 682]|nr:hypothetical protein IL306_005397 [Fusarium sp. DS 682]
MQALTGTFKGMVPGDPPGLGKSLAALEMAALLGSPLMWWNLLEQGRNSHSRRVKKIVGTVRQHLDWYPNDSIIIVNKSVWFLGIVAVALSKSYHLLPYDKHNGRLDIVQRHLGIKKVIQAANLHILLISRDTGGQGLNLQFANVVIRRGSWWKQAWADRAAGRVHRPREQKAFFICELRAEDCAIEKYKMDVRDKKNRVNTRILLRSLEAAMVNPRYVGGRYFEQTGFHPACDRINPT